MHLVTYSTEFLLPCWGMLTSTEGTVMADQANRQLYHCSAARSNAAAAQHVTPRPLRVKDSSVGRKGAALVPLAYIKDKESVRTDSKELEEPRSRAVRAL